MTVARIARYPKWILLLLSPVLLAWARPIETHNAKPEKITVTILAISTMTRNGYGGDEDIYLASLSSREGASQLIRLSDWTPSGGPAVPAMAVGRRFRLLATRTVWCDSTARRFFLPASTGETSQFLPTDTPDDLPIPCYRDQHESIRLVRKVPSDARF